MMHRRGRRPGTRDDEVVVGGSGRRLGASVPDAIARARLIATALAFAAGLEVLRPLFPIAFDAGEQRGFVLVGIGALCVYTLGALAPPAVRLLGRDRGVPVVLVSLAVARMAVQIVHPLPAWLAVLATGIVLVTWATLALAASAQPEASETLVFGLVLGLSLDAGLRSAFLTWDPVWQSGVVPLIFAALLAAGLVLCAFRGVRLQGEAVASWNAALRIGLIGPFLALEVLFLQNVAFVASQAKVSPASASAVVLIGDLLAVAALVSLGRRAPSRLLIAGAGVLLVATSASLLTPRNLSIIPALLIAATVAALLLAIGLRGLSTSGRGAVPRAAVGCALLGVGFLLPVLLHQIHYEVPLPFPSTAIPPALALVVAIGGLTAPSLRRVVRWSWSLVAIPVALLVVPAGLAVLAPPRMTVPLVDHTAIVDRTVRVVDFNVRSAVDLQGQLDPEAIARTIEEQDPDVVVLQEVARGWVIAGTLDLADWLSRRLEMPYVFAPAADEQFGNAILSRLPILERETGLLPFGVGPQQRSFVRVVIGVGTGPGLSVIGTHLQRADDATTRKAQIDEILAVWDGAPRTVIAGDMNAQPYESDILAFEEAGFRSAQDVTGHGDETTSAEPKEPGDRVDWMFGTPDLTFVGFAVVPTDASDHLPLVGAVQLS